MLTNIGKYFQLKYPTRAQVEIWILKRNNLSGRKIAQQRDVTPAFVSKTLKEANKRIKSLLKSSDKAKTFSYLAQNRVLQREDHLCLAGQHQIKNLSTNFFVKE